MPCRKAEHNHEWPSTGAIMILPCETICSLCDSTKEYKPASALRKHVLTHIKNDKLPLSLLRSASGRPKLSTRGFTLHRQTAVIQSPTAEQEPQISASTPISSAQQVVQGSPLEQPAQHPSDNFAGADLYACGASDCYARFRTLATLLKHLHESHRASPDGPALPPTSAASSIAYNSMRQVEQSSTADASELVAPPSVPVVSPVENTHRGTTPAEATVNYMQTHSPNASTYPYVPLSLPGYGPLRSFPSLAFVHPRAENEYMTEMLKVTETVDSVKNTVDDGKTAPTSFRIPGYAADLSEPQLHRGPCWRCSILSLECRQTDRTKACDACQYSGTTLQCFGFRLEHLVDQILDCNGDFPRVLHWNHRILPYHVTITFNDCETVLPLPSTFTLEKLCTDSRRRPWYLPDGWAKAFRVVVDAAARYRRTDFEHKAIENGLRCLDICLWILWTIMHDFEDVRFHTDHATQYLSKTNLTDFLSILFDTTIASSESEHKEQLLDVFYGTLILCMIRFVLFAAFRHFTRVYEPERSQANHDPTFLDGPKSHIYQPMLLLLESSMSTFEGGNAHFVQAAAVVNISCYGSLSPHPQISTSMYSQASGFISYYSRPNFDPLRL